MPKVVVVTGSNKGIGLACVEQLAKIFSDGIVYLTARDEGRGKDALHKLKQKGLTNVIFHQLDICDGISRETFVNDIRRDHGKINVLVNNAGIAFKRDSSESFGVQAEITLATNYWATEKFSDQVFPLLDKNSRVVNVSSCLGHLSCLNSGREPGVSSLKTKLADPGITIETLNSLAADFVHRSKENTHMEAGWIPSAYSVSKILVSVLTRIQQREIDKSRPNENVLINAVHPGYVDTDMTSHRGVFSPERGSRAVVWCATIPEDQESPRGGFVWHDNRLVDFTASSYPAD